ncbi:hypothetical protein Tco_0000705 [Tanacetum coccineum]
MVHDGPPPLTVVDRWSGGGSGDGAGLRYCSSVRGSDAGWDPSQSLKILEWVANDWNSMRRWRKFLGSCNIHAPPSQITKLPPDLELSLEDDLKRRK